MPTCRQLISPAYVYSIHTTTAAALIAAACQTCVHLTWCMQAHLHVLHASCSVIGIMRTKRLNILASVQRHWMQYRGYPSVHLP